MTRTDSSVDAPARPSRLRVALFVVNLLLLVWLVLWRFEVPWIGSAGIRQLKLVPFAATGDFGASAPLEVVANFCFFVPLGLAFALVAPTASWWRALALVAGTSAGLEAAQWLLAVGSADVTDLIVNTAGGLVGFGLVRWLRPLLGGRTERVLTWVLAVATALAPAAASILLFTPMRYGQVDVVVDPGGHSQRSR